MALKVTFQALVEAVAVVTLAGLTSHISLGVILSVYYLEIARDC